MSVKVPTSVVKIDGHYYAVAQGTYIRKWQRQFTATLVANIQELNWVDRGPGIKTYDFQLLILTWAQGSLPYQLGVTETWDQQVANLETAYLKINSAMEFLDVFGEAPTLGGVYFTQLNETIPNYATPQKPYVLMDVEVIEALRAIS